jgi:outer membrane protein assembly factor BamB
MRLMSLCAPFLIFACSDYKIRKTADAVDGRGDTGLGTEDSDGGPDIPDELSCPEFSVDPYDAGLTDACPSAPEGGFTPIVEWNALPGKSCKAQPVVGDLDGDGFPEVVLNATDLFAFPNRGKLYVLNGRTGDIIWQRNADMGYGSAPALGDVDGDGEPDIVVTREYEHSLGAVGSYSVVVYTRSGEILWESEQFPGNDFDHAAAPILSDMDHDGHVEIVVGRVILNSDGTTRGVGVAGRGSFGGVISEGSLSAVADLNLDGTEEVIVGNAMYSPDGAPLWVDFTQSDGMISVANLDDDAEGEFIAVSNNTVRAMDTSGAVIWGPLTMPSANITSPAAIGDIDADGEPEIIVAGGSELWAIERDGTVKWTAEVTDESGATGASIFDFEGDGIAEVVYIDEQEMLVFDGETGAVKFYSTEHASATMYDYPTVADIDGDNQAEIVVCHDGFGSAISAYGDLDESWASARPLWNQHAYSITNVNDDLSIPVDATPNFTLYNNWHAGVARVDADALVDDLTGIINNVCEDDCDLGYLLITFQVANRSERVFEGTIPVSFYADFDDGRVLVDTVEVDLSLASAMSSEGINVAIDATTAIGASGLVMRVDDDGSGTGIVTECSELDNVDSWGVAICD